MSQITTSQAYTNYTLARQKAIVDLLETCFIGTKVYTGQRAIGARDSDGPITMPCFMVEALGTKAVKNRMGAAGAKWTRKFSFAIYFYVSGTNRDDLVQKQTGYMEALIKLFSDDAAGGIGYGMGGFGMGPFGGGPNYTPGAFKNYPGNWWNSEIVSATFSGAVVSPIDTGAFIRAGRFELEAEDSIIQ